MNVLILTGSGEIGKRDTILKIKKEFDETAVSYIDSSQSALENLDNILAASPLFDQNRLIILQNPPQSLDLTKIYQLNNATLVITSGQIRVDSLLFKSAKKLKAKIINFEGERELLAFPYLDSLIEQKQGAFLELEKLLDEYGGVYVLSMIYYLLRRNILPMPSSVFAQKKIRSQKERYHSGDWERLYRVTLDTEFKIKSGLLEEKLGLTNLTYKFLSYPN